MSGGIFVFRVRCRLIKKSTTKKGKTKGLDNRRAPQSLRSRLSDLKAVMAEYLAPTHATGQQVKYLGKMEEMSAHRSVWSPI